MTERLREKATVDAIAKMLRHKDWPTLINTWWQAIHNADRWFSATIVRQFRASDIPAEYDFEVEQLRLESALLLNISSLIEIHIRAMLRMRDLAAEQQATIEAYVKRILESNAASVSFRAQLRVTQARQHGQPLDTAEALFEAGRVSIQQGQLGRAEAALTQALQYFSQHPEQPHYAESLLYLGICRRAGQFYAGSLEALSSCLKQYEAQNNLGRQAQTLREIGCTLRLQARNDEAVSALQRSIELCQHDQDHENQALGFLGLADVWGGMNRFDEAETALKQAGQLYESVGQTFGQADVLFGLTQLAILTSQTSAGTAYLDALRGLIAVTPTLSQRFSNELIDALGQRLAQVA